MDVGVFYHFSPRPWSLNDALLLRHSAVVWQRFIRPSTLPSCCPGMFPPRFVVSLPADCVSLRTGKIRICLLLHMGGRRAVKAGMTPAGQMCTAIGNGGCSGMNGKQSEVAMNYQLLWKSAIFSVSSMMAISAVQAAPLNVMTEDYPPFNMQGRGQDCRAIDRGGRRAAQACRRRIQADPDALEAGV